MAIRRPPVDALPEPGFFVGDVRHSRGDGEHPHVYAANGEVTRAVPLAGPAVVEEAVAAARRAASGWRQVAPGRRRDLLHELAALVRANAPRLAAIQTIENGVPVRFAATLPAIAADHVEYFAGWADKIGGKVIAGGGGLDYTRDEPYGVVAVIIPWNGPLISIAQVLAPALATGNVVVLKSSELAPFTGMVFGELALAAGFPPGVVNVVAAGPAGSEALVRHPGVDKIHFTGSAGTARRLLAAASERLTPTCLELGGKSALLVFADADPMAAAQHALAGAVVMAGQGCANATRVLIEAPLYDRMLRLVAGLMRRVAVGDPFDAATDMGPVISAAACERILACIARSRATSRLVSGGERLGGELADGYFIAPTLFADADGGSELAQEEIFGPVIACAPFADEAAAIEQANATRYGLAAYVHTADLRRAHRVAAALEAGSVSINGLQPPSPGAPFGGIKESGHGRVGGLAAIRELTRPKNIWIAE